MFWQLRTRLARLFEIVFATPLRTVLAVTAAVVTVGAFYEVYFDTIPFPRPQPQELHPLDSFPFLVSNDSKFFDMMISNFECKMESFINQSNEPVQKGIYVVSGIGRARFIIKVKDGKLQISIDTSSIPSHDKNVVIRKKTEHKFLCNISKGFDRLFLFKKNPDGHLEPNGTEGPIIPIKPVSLNIRLIVHYYTMPFQALPRTFQSDPFEIVYKDGRYFWSELLPMR